MAYNLQSLITILQQILNPEQTRWIVDHNKPRLESLLEKAETMQQILEKSPLTKIGNLESQIRDVVYKAEDIIESQVVHQMRSNRQGVRLKYHMVRQMRSNRQGVRLKYHMVRQMRSNPQGVRFESQMVRQMRSNPQGVSFTLLTPDLEQVIQQLDSATEQVLKLVKGKTMLTGSSTSSGASFSHDLTADVQQATQELESLKPVEGKTMLTGSSSSSGASFSHDLTADVQQATQELESLKPVEGKTMLTGSSSSSGASFSHDLTADVQQATQELESLKVVEVEGKKMPTGGPLSSSKNDLVGVEAHLMQLKDRLTNMERKLEIIPITGMGGIGKTTLARNLYEDPLIVYRFDYRGWATISQDYNMRAILVSLLRCIIGKECDQHIEKKGNDELQVILYRSLCGRRYMIMLDDIWSTKIWDEIKMYFPDNNNGSRIVITTRESGVAKYVAGSSSLHHEMELLGTYESWNLLRHIVFGEEEKDCPDRVLQEMGKKIAGDCGGLPLAINVIGGLLSKIERSKDAWMKIGNDVLAAIAESDERCSNILSLSYNNLPNHLKPCFLYMGAFPEDYQIKGSRLVRMWVAEGFVRSNIGNESLEEEAEDCLKGLVERNLLLVREYKYGKPKRYSMHDLLRDLCIRKCDEDKFLHVKNGAFSSPRRVTVDTSHGMEAVNASAESMSLTRSFIGIGYTIEIPWCDFSALRLVRMLDIMDIKLREFPTEIFELVNLRFLAFQCYSCIPRGISRLWHLQILIAKACWFDDASEIWELPELRYLNAPLVLDDIEEMINSVKKKKLLKLQMIPWVAVSGSVIMRDFFKSIPNIKKLGIVITDWKTSMEIDLSNLHKLEIIKHCNCYLPKVRFPCNIRKLILHECVINREVLRTLSGLHKLEVLKIYRCWFEREEDRCDGDKFETEKETSDGDGFESKEERCEEELELATDGDEFEREEETSCYEDGELAADGDESESEEEWVLADVDEFPSLQFLSLEKLRIVRWIADETNFPRLRHLRVYFCRRLEEIPSGIGEIPTLQLIHLEHCSNSAEASARQIVEEQQSDYGNYDLKLSIR